MCISCGKTNATKVEVDRHMMFQSREKLKVSCEQCEKAFTQKFQFSSIQELLLGRSHVSTCQYCVKYIIISSILRKHASQIHNTKSKKNLRCICENIIYYLQSIIQLNHSPSTEVGGRPSHLQHLTTFFVTLLIQICLSKNINQLSTQFPATARGGCTNTCPPT